VAGREGGDLFPDPPQQVREARVLDQIHQRIIPVAALGEPRERGGDDDDLCGEKID
jgi:hypothetical protein